MNIPTENEIIESVSSKLKLKNNKKYWELKRLYSTSLLIYSLKYTPNSSEYIFKISKTPKKEFENAKLISKLKKSGIKTCFFDKKFSATIINKFGGDLMSNILNDVFVYQKYKKEDLFKIIENLAKLLCEIHELKIKYTNIPKDFFKEDLYFFGNSKVKKYSEKLIERIKDERVPFTFQHNDFSAKNVIIDNKTPKIIDFEHYDLASGLNDVFDFKINLCLIRLNPSLKSSFIDILIDHFFKSYIKKSKLEFSENFKKLIELHRYLSIYKKFEVRKMHKKNFLLYLKNKLANRYYNIYIKKEVKKMIDK